MATALAVYVGAAAADGALGQPATAILGTLAYVAPEQANGIDAVGPRSDIYALGALLYFLLTGRPPFVRPSVLKTIVAPLSDPVPPPASIRPDVPEDLRAVVLRCLAKVPTERFRDAEELDRALAGCACADSWAAPAAPAWWRGRDADTPNDLRPTDAETQTSPPW